MTLLASASHLHERAALAARGELHALAESLAADLLPLLAHEPDIPTAKAWLSRTGGRCVRDGAMLDFHPFQPHEHRCPRCNSTYRGDLHDRWWVTWRQLWLAERAVHAALLALVRPAGAAAHGALADSLLERYAEGYGRYPNQDNALGPTRPFFSTYLESIWLLQLTVALSLRETALGASSLGARVRDQVIAPSARLIAGYDEGASNRQVWNNAALLAAGRLLDDAALVERAAFGPSGLVRHLDDGLLADGSWYEGENYHLFAHRGLWYGVQLCEAGGIALPPALLARFADGFATPFVTALPDLTFPARRDSQFGVSLRQWRFAELAELGLARSDDPRLAAALASLYDTAVLRTEPGRWRSTAEAERNERASGLRRADLGWRSLLFARPTLPPLGARPPRSTLLDGQGLALFRRDHGRLYAALDYGHSGGGHGHPDRLNVLLAHDATRWLDDVGTGSYVDPSLHWYRSTLAHNAPLVNGRSQRRVHGTLAAYEERPAAGWADAVVDGVAPGVQLRRTLVVLDGYLVTELSWSAPPDTRLELPLHADGTVLGVEGWHSERAAPDESTGVEDGWRFVTASERAVGAPFASAVRFEAVRGDSLADAWLLAPPDAELWRAVAPGAPGAGDARFHLVRARGAAGRIVVVWCWDRALAGVTLAGGVTLADGALQVALRDGTRHEHRRLGSGWQVGLVAGGARSSIHLGGERTLAAPAADDAGGPVLRPDVVPTVRQLPYTAALRESSYRRSERSWADAGSPSADISIRTARGALVVEIAVHNGALAFRAALAENPLDNEHPDTNSDGVQLYVALADGSVAAWLLAPDPAAPAVRVTRASQDSAGLPIEASWHALEGGRGYLLRCALSLAALAAGRGRVVALDVIVNETAPGRERRRGQLVLSGGAGEFVYLRGDRQPPERFIPFAIADVDV